MTEVGSRRGSSAGIGVVVLTAYNLGGLTKLLGSDGSTGRMEQHIKPPYIHINQYAEP
jgi:hypothetical protein